MTQDNAPTSETTCPSGETGRTSRRALLMILALGVVLRVTLLIWFQDQPLYVEDEKAYHAIASTLAEHGVYGISASEPTSQRPPLYPFLVSGVYRVCGIDNLQAVRAVQALLGLLLVLPVYRLTADMFSQRAATWAAGLCCFYPSLMGMNYLLLSETLFGLLTCCACLALLRYLQSESILWLVAVGVLFGLATLTRSVLWLFPPFLGLFLLFAIKQHRWSRRLAIVAVPLAAFVLTFLPWTVRCSKLQNTLVTIDHIGGRNFMMGNYEHTPLYRSWDAIAIDGLQSWDVLLFHEVPGWQTLTQGQRDKIAMRRGFHFVFQNPWLTMKRDTVKFFNFWQLERTLIAGAARGYWGVASKPLLAMLALVVIASYVTVLFSAIFGFAVLPPADQRMHWFLLLLVGFVCAVHTVVFAHSRYHVSLMPLLFIYAGNALANGSELWKRRGRRSFRIAGVISALIGASWFWEFFMVDLPRFRDQLGT